MTSDVYTFSLNNSLYKDYKFGDNLYLAPSLNLDFTYICKTLSKKMEKLLVESAKKVEAFYATLGAGIDFKYNLLKFNNSKLYLIE